MTSLKSFAEKWCHPDRTPDPVDEDELNSVEKGFEIRFPSDYRKQILAVGLPSPTLALLSAINAREVGLHDLSYLCKPVEIKGNTLGWREAGLPEDLLVIGNDCMGNKFCYRLSDLKKADAKQPIVFWDHDFLETDEIAPSFSDWIDGFQGAWSDGAKCSGF